VSARGGDQRGRSTTSSMPPNTGTTSVTNEGGGDGVAESIVCKSRSHVISQWHRASRLFITDRMFSTSSWRASASLIPRQRTRSEGPCRRAGHRPRAGVSAASASRYSYGPDRGHHSALGAACRRRDRSPRHIVGTVPACSSRSGGRTVGAHGGASPSGAVARWRSWAARLKLSATACPLASPVTSSLGQPLVPAFTVAAAGATCRHCGDPATRERVGLMVGCRADRFVNCAEEETERARA
jgi:hypothetical protein